MRIRPFIELKDFEKLKGWTDNEREHAMWCAGQISYPITREQLQKVLEQNALQNDDSAYIAMEDGGELIGFFCYYVDIKTNVGYLRYLIIDPDKRGREIGTEMLRLILKYAREITNVDTIRLDVFADNEQALQMYRQAGFEIGRIEKDAFEFHGEHWDRYCMYVGEAGMPKEDQMIINEVTPDDKLAEARIADSAPVEMHVSEAVLKEAALNETTLNEQVKTAPVTEMTAKEMFANAPTDEMDALARAALFSDGVVGENLHKETISVATGEGLAAPQVTMSPVKESPEEEKALSETPIENTVTLTFDETAVSEKPSEEKLEEKAEQEESAKEKEEEKTGQGESVEEKPANEASVQSRDKSMLVQKYKDMLSAKSVIRQLSEFATERGREIGYENVFDYSLGNPSVPVPKAFTDRMIQMLATRNPMELHGYSPSLGITSVREKIADSLERRFGIPYRKEHIFMASGAAGALAHAFRLVAEPGDEILTFAPYFPEYGPYVNLTGAVLKIVPPDLTAFQINFEQFENMLTEKVTAVLINTPNNPSGVVYTAETIRKLTAIMNRKANQYGHAIYLISDEPYREIVFAGVENPCVSKYYDNTIMCYSFSKSLSLPGERIGYVAINPACKDAETMINMCGQISRGIGHNCPPSIIQLAVAEVLDRTADLKVYETNMNLIYDTLIELGFTVVKPGGTFYIFPKALEEDAVAFSQKALKYDLILVPADSFGAPGYFRMAYCIPTEKVKRSLTALRKFVEQEYHKA